MFFIFADNKDSHKVLDEFNIRPDLTMDCGVSCSLTSGKIFYLRTIQNILGHNDSQVSDFCPLGYLFADMETTKVQINCVIWPVPWFFVLR